MPAMKPSDLLDAIIFSITKQRPLFIEGDAGVGKSQLVAQAVASCNRKLRDWRTAQMDATDIKGIPHVNGDGRAHWAVPDWLPHDPNCDDVIFLDEINRGAQLVQNACLQLILDRKVGDYVLPPNVAMIAAGNPDSYRGVQKMSEALANRFLHVQFTVDTNDWCTWALDHDIAAELIAFIRFRPHLLHAYDRQSTEKAYPSPRSWQFVNEILDGKLRPEIELGLCEGAVGSGPAGELAGFLQIYRQLPSLDGILMNPDKAKVPDDPGPCLAIATGLARKATQANFDRVITYVNRMPKEWGVYCVKDAARLAPEVEHTKAFIRYASENADIMG
jgi:hypothetical protein